MLKMGWGKLSDFFYLIIYIMMVQRYAFSSTPTIIYCWYSDFYILLAFHYIVVWEAKKQVFIIICCGVRSMLEKASNYMLVAID